MTEYVSDVGRVVCDRWGSTTSLTAMTSAVYIRSTSVDCWNVTKNNSQLSRLSTIMTVSSLL